MSASKLHPNMFRGEESSGGFIAVNRNPTSANSPDWKGRLYLPGVGWYWVNGWVRDGREGPETLISLSAQEMTNEQVVRLFSAKGGKPREKPRPPPEDAPAADSGQEDIPF